MLSVCLTNFALPYLSWLTCSAGSERNVSKLTLDGVDVMGERLAEEVGFSFKILESPYIYC